MPTYWRQRRRTPHYYSNVTDAFLGVDIGKRLGYSTMALLIEPVYSYADHAFHSPTEFPMEHSDYLRDQNMTNMWSFRPPDPPLYLSKLERIPLGTSYPKVVERVIEVADHVAATAGNCQ